MNAKEALELLGLKPPKARSGMKSSEVRKMYADWKKEALPKAVREAQKRYHPDISKEDDAEEKFKAIPEAEEKVRSLQFRIPPDKVTSCRVCKSHRNPEDAKFCHSCGLRYLETKTEKCPACDTKHEGSAKFCHECGWDFKMPDYLIERLRSSGLSETRIEKLEEEGILSQWRTLSPTNPSLQEAIQEEVRRETLFRDAFMDALRKPR